ncbi:MAG: Zeta toxin family protein [Chloroflexi bacterium CFX6]|nr:Zeta toxin family protein [Chloroflexi bacterium CFX6]
MAEQSPLVVVIAGPNGAGKSTTAPRLLQDALAVDEFVNADAIAAGISAFRPESVALEAGRMMLTRIRLLAKAHRSIAFETTLASRSFAPWLRGLREDGYRVHVVFLSLPNADMAVARVAERVRSGGHDVPEEVVRRRYRSGLRNLFDMYSGIADAWQLFDNSSPGPPRLIASGGGAIPPSILDDHAWHALKEQLA